MRNLTLVMIFCCGCNADPLQSQADLADAVDLAATRAADLAAPPNGGADRCVSAGGTCIASDSTNACASGSGHLGGADVSCAGAICCLPELSCGGPELFSCCAGNSTMRPICVGGLLQCQAGQMICDRHTPSGELFVNATGVQPGRALSIGETALLELTLTPGITDPDLFSASARVTSSDVDWQVKLLDSDRMTELTAPFELDRVPKKIYAQIAVPAGASTATLVVDVVAAHNAALETSTVLPLAVGDRPPLNDPSIVLRSIDAETVIGAAVAQVDDDGALSNLPGTPAVVFRASAAVQIATYATFPTAAAGSASYQVSAALLPDDGPWIVQPSQTEVLGRSPAPLRLALAPPDGGVTLSETRRMLRLTWTRVGDGATAQAWIPIVGY